MTRGGEPRAGSGTVALVSAHVVLGSALAPALSAVGWQTVRACAWELLDDEIRQDRTTCVVLVADECGHLPSGPPPGTLRSPTAAVVALGRRVDLRALIAAIERGAIAALDSDLPFTELVRALDTLLLQPASWPDRRDLLSRLRSRASEAAMVRALTARELDLLVDLMRGLSAAEIAREAHLALPTVRSHIQKILAKTGVSSQVAAVARAHASGAEPAIDVMLRHLHQF